MRAYVTGRIIAKDSGSETTIYGFHLSKNLQRPEINIRVRFLFPIFVLFLSMQAFGQQDAPIAPDVEEIYLARDDGKGGAGEQVTEFRTTDVPIYCVVLLDSRAKAIVKMNFVAVSVAGVKPETKVVTTSYTTIEGQNRVNFTGRPDGRWTPGKYRMDLFVDGRLARDIEFEIKPAAKTGFGTSFAPTDAKAKLTKRRSKIDP